MIAFTDDDAVPREDWLEQLVNAIDRHDAAAAGGTFQESDPLLDAIRWRKPLPTVEQVDDVGLVGNGANILFRREWLDRCLREDGYVFNECFAGSGEDWELIWRFQKRGARMVYVPNHPVHLRKVTPMSLCRHSFHRGVGIARLYRIMNQDQVSVAPHESLLWGQGIQRARPRWMRALWKKLFGSFERRLFRDARHFWSYRLGEKAQAVGFVWELAFRTPMSRLQTKTGRES
ncbi:MAG: glycosyltransferase [Nitrospiraceae bacterium]|nr:glycosyltransferase [Nitrospiraceae bacterium]